MSKTDAAGRGPGSPAGLDSGALRVLALAVLALTGGFLASALLADTSSPVVAATIGGFAVFGVFWAASLVLRVLRRVSPGKGPQAVFRDAVLSHAILAASADALAVVEDGERVVEANAAYRALCGEAGGPLPTPERLLAALAGARAAVAELLNAVAEGQGSDVRIGAAFDGAPGAVRVSVQPLDSPRRALWALRMIEPATQISEAPTAEGAIGQAECVLAAEGLEPAPLALLNDQAAAALLEAWERAPAGVARLVGDRVMLANAGLCRLLGYSLAEAMPAGLALREVVAAGSWPRLQQALADGRGPVTLELELTRKDGSALAAVARLGVADAAGAASMVVLPRAALTLAATLPADAANADGTRPGSAAASTAASQQIASAPTAAPAMPAMARGAADRFFQSAPLALAVVDAQGRIRDANAAFARLFLAEGAGSAVNRPLAAVIAERDAPAVDAFVAAARSGEQPIPPCDVAAGARSARLYAAPLGVAAGTGDDIALCAIDTTEQKALEAQFAQSQRLQAVGHLAGGVAHDFNNVLTAIIGYCDLLLAKHRPSDPSFPDIMQIKQNANRAAALVRQLLAFSRRQTLRPQVIELTDVISDVSELLRRLIGERITLEVQHARDLWPVKVDVNQFEQVIVNLVVNARDAMPGGGTLTLRTANVPASATAAYGAGDLAAADYVLVEVEDTGSGIPADIIDKIFEPFFSTKEVGKGTGLGLSTVYGIVQQTGGTILAASAPGQGAVFRVFLPRHVPALEEEPPRPAEPEVKVADSTGQGRILLVEDEDAVRAFASRALSARGYEVLTAGSGVEALELLNGGGPAVDLVISDVVMPEMDGPSLLRELRARDPGMKVIFISGYAEEAFAKNLPPEEHFAFLPKPFSLKQLVAAVNTSMRGAD